MSENHLPQTVQDLRPAPYNPRRISKAALSELAKYMKEYGDLSGVVWNRRTGHLIGAHQRTKNFPKSAKITSIPQMTGDNEEYGFVEAKGHKWTVRIVDWDVEREKRANIIANNPTIQGEFDLPQLADILKDIGFYTVGFTPMDIEVSDFSDEDINAILGRPSIMDESQEPDEVKEAIDELEDIQRAGNEAKKTQPGDFKDSIGTKIRREMRDRQEDMNYYRTVVFQSDAEAEQFMNMLGYPGDRRYIDGKFLASMLKGEDNGEEERQEG